MQQEDNLNVYKKRPYFIIGIFLAISVLVFIRQFITEINFSKSIILTLGVSALFVLFITFLIYTYDQRNKINSLAVNNFKKATLNGIFGVLVSPIIMVTIFILLYFVGFIFSV